jgi:hypothetical protein
MKMCLPVMLFFLFPVMSGTAQESAVIPFENVFTLETLLKYNFLQFRQNELANDRITTNRPFDFGFGFGYKDLSLVFSIAIPNAYDTDIMKSSSLDWSLTYFSKQAVYVDGYFKYYNGFHTEKRGEFDEEVDLRIIMTGLCGEYIFNAGHSLRGVYRLDRRQAASNGSVLAGGGVFYSSIYPEYSKYSKYAKTRGVYILPARQNIFYAGPNMGYSYIWVLNEHFFVNLLVVAGPVGALDGNGIDFGIQLLPRFSCGYHGNSWSINTSIDSDSLIYLQRKELENVVTAGTFNILFSKRL